MFAKTALHEAPSVAPNLSVAQLTVWTAALLVHVGLASADAQAIATSLIEAEARGVSSHGLILLPVYAERVRTGGIKPNYVVSTIRDGGSTLLLDGDGGPGQAVAHCAITLAVERARQYGLAYVVARNSNHAGMLATYGLTAARSGFVAFVMTNSGPSVSPWRGRQRKMGNNALCLAFPSTPDPIVFDMATGTVACGKVRIAALHGSEIPGHWILDHEGLPSRNPADFDAGGSMTPLGGYKGYGLAVMVDLLTGILAGGVASPGVKNQRGANDTPTGATQSFLVIDPNMFGGLEAAVSAAESYADSLRSSPAADPMWPILMPGDPELAAHEHATAHGISFATPLTALLNDLAHSLAFELLPR